MKLTKIFNKIKTLPKKVLTSLAFAAATLPVVSLVTAQSAPVLMEGSIKSRNTTTNTEYADSTNAKVDEVVQVQMWYHNRELPDTTAAQNTRVKFTVPTAQGKSQVVTGKVSADNANTITDTTNINLSLDRARLDYIEGSAKWRYNKGAMDGDATCKTGMQRAPERCYQTVAISDDVVTKEQGVHLGNTPGCNAYEATVVIQVRVVADVVSVNKFVRHAGQGSADWKTSTTAKPGDNVEYLIKFKNEGNTQLDDVMVGDNLPKYNTYVNGSTNLSNGTNPNGIKITNDNITKGGINVGNYTAGAVGYVWFSAKLDPIQAYEKCGEYDIRNVGVVRPKGMNEFYNTAQVIIKVECKDVPDKPDYRCVSLAKKELGGRKYQYTTTTAQQRATVKEFKYEINGPNNYRFEKLQSANQLDHELPATPGAYDVRVHVTFDVEGEGEKTVTSDACKLTINVPQEDVPPTTTTTPPSGKLPVTGAGDLIGMFVATTVAATLAHKFVLGRRYL